MFNKTINLPEGQRIGFSALDKRLGSPSVFNIVGLEKIPGKTCNTEDCPMCEGRGRVDVLIPTNYNYYLIPIQNFKEKETYNVTERKLNHSDFVNIIKDITDGFDR